ncbi:cellulose biosynthesis protein BcsQ [Alloalcanivorax marinus]|uniref:cellulose biosynthesis protein BcsQ n=1 Tax=Alloalcanivorax marinus TaxID=1177169 RepID=UPI001931F32B|nr:cellulose biosynthesis protein BcsQ [Alloalcanivorax marinus]MBL7249485.1 cellulose synthase operon protein YhjQ [Alloalcanivorax marinus]
MALISVDSPKGGVGKTTCAANLAYGIRRLGYRVAVIDFDAQNALRLHFGVSLTDGAGYVHSAVDQDDWRPLARSVGDGIQLLPYGEVPRFERQVFDRALEEPGFLNRPLGSLASTPGTVVIADLPPGDSSALWAVSRLADLRITVLLADSASLSLLPRVESGDFFPEDVPAGSRHGFILNQVDPRQRLNTEVKEIMERRHGSELLGEIHRDEAFPEANARQRSVFEQAPHSRGAADMKQCVNRVLQQLAEIGGTAVEVPGGAS